MKKYIITLLLLYMISSICIAKDLFSIQNENWSLLFDTEAEKVFLTLIFIIFCLILMIKYISHEKIEITKINENFFKSTPMNLLNNRFARGEITQKDFENIKNKIRSVNSDIEKFKIIASLKSVVRTIPEKCS